MYENIRKENPDVSQSFEAKNFLYIDRTACKFTSSADNKKLSAQIREATSTGGHYVCLR